MIKRYIPLGFAVIFAVLTSISAYHFLQDRSGVSHASPIDTVLVVVAKERITIGEKLAEHKLSVVAWPGESAPDNSYKSVKSVTGRTARFGLDPNEPILESKLLADGENFSSLIPEEMRAVSVSVQHSSALAQILERGTLVDVVTVKTIKGTEMVSANVIVEKAHVLSVYKQDPEAALKNDLPQDMEVTLIVTPDEAKRIIAAMNQGGLQLIVRNEKTTIQSLI